MQCVHVICMSTLTGIIIENNNSVYMCALISLIYRQVCTWGWGLVRQQKQVQRTCTHANALDRMCIHVCMLHVYMCTCTCTCTCVCMCGLTMWLLPRFTVNQFEQRKKKGFHCVDLFLRKQCSVSTTLKKTESLWAIVEKYIFVWFIPYR